METPCHRLGSRYRLRPPKSRLGGAQHVLLIDAFAETGQLHGPAFREALLALRAVRPELTDRQAAEQDFVEWACISARLCRNGRSSLSLAGISDARHERDHVKVAKTASYVLPKALNWGVRVSRKP